MREAWRRFLHPYGRRRDFVPWKWEWRDRILVSGELLAVGAAIAAIPVELSEWTFAPWLVIGATLVGTSALLWYAFDLISAGETPLANRSAHTIRQVVSAIDLEKEGVTFDWENIGPDGGIPGDWANWSGLRADVKAIMDEYNVPLSVAAQILAGQERDRAKDAG